MHLFNGLKKIFGRHDKFEPPNQRVLTSKEREAIIVLFSSMVCILLVSIILLFF